ncbi:MAG: DNA-binding protein YbiB [Pseudomonadota bacterium]|jgi:anthranilate phosphoribosyltransferase
MSFATYLREIGRGREGARSLTRAQAADLMGQILAGEVSDVQLGGFALAMRIKGETAEELAGFMDAVLPRNLALPAADRVVLLPSYNGARKLPNLTPLLALLLARAGVPVLVHGMLKDASRVTSASIFTELGLPPCVSAAELAPRWMAGMPAYMALERFNPPLHTLLTLREQLGLRNPGHTLAKILPALPGALRVVNHTHPEYAGSLADYLDLDRANAVLLRGTEGEPVADARRTPRMAVWLAGERRADLGCEAAQGSLVSVPGLPASDAVSTAHYIDEVLAGRAPVPAPVARQVELLVGLRDQMALNSR